MRILKKPRGSALFQYLRERLLSFYRRAIVVTPGLIDFSVFLAQRIRGKLPGNLDILWRILASQDKGYMMDVFWEIFEECKSTTVNLRILWTDKVRDPTLIVPISVCCCAVLILGCFSI